MLFFYIKNNLIIHISFHCLKSAISSTAISSTSFFWVTSIIFLIHLETLFNLTHSFKKIINKRCPKRWPFSRNSFPSVPPKMERRTIKEEEERRRIRRMVLFYLALMPSHQTPARENMKLVRCLESSASTSMDCMHTERKNQVILT